MCRRNRHMGLGAGYPPRPGPTWSFDPHKGRAGVREARRLEDNGGGQPRGGKVDHSGRP